MTRAPATLKAWLVAYVDPTREPPAICEAGIFPDNKPTKAERHNGFGQLVLLCAERPTYAEAIEDIKMIVCGPEWRWLYRVPVLTSGFQHVWGERQIQLADPIARVTIIRVCGVCGVPEANMEARKAGGRGDPDRCLVSHVGVCSVCGQRRAILQGDALCVACRYPSR